MMYKPNNSPTIVFVKKKKKSLIIVQLFRITKLNI